MRSSIALFAMALALPTSAHAAAPTPVLEHERKLLSMIDQLRDDEAWQERLEAAVYLGRTGDIRARRPLTKALEDPHYAVRSAAVRALVKLEDARAVRPLIDRLGDQDGFVRGEARSALESFDPELRRPYLVRALGRHVDPGVRLETARLLAQDGSGEAVEALLGAIGDESEVGPFAVSAIRALGDELSETIFLSGLSHADYGVQVAAIRALAELETPSATEPLIERLDSEVPEVTLAAAEGLRALSIHIDKSKQLVLAKRASTRFERARALKVLGVLGGEDAARLLLNALDDPDVLVRGAAVSGVASMRDVRAIPKLEEMRKLEANGRIISLVKTTLANLHRLRDKPKNAS